MKSFVRIVDAGSLSATVAQLHTLPWLALSTFYLDEVAQSHQTDGKMHRFAIQPRLITDSLYAIRNGALADFWRRIGFHVDCA